MRSLGVVLAVLVSGCCWDPSPAAAHPSAPPKPSALELELAAMTPADDARQEKAIQMAQKAKYLGAVDWSRGQAEVEVGPAFAALPLQQKESLVKNVAILGMRKGGTAFFTLSLRDPLTGASVGSYSTMYGGLQLR